jgi:hypothetical protein
MPTRSETFRQHSGAMNKKDRRHTGVVDLGTGKLWLEQE